MRKNSASSSSFGGFLSPNYSDNKGWCSERVPPINARRQIGSASALTTPFYSNRAIPSKWEDAERWICVNPSVNSQFSEQKRQKSKSGPIVPPPPLPRTVEAPPTLMVVSSPFSTGVLEAESVFRGSVGGHGYSRSWVDLMSEETSSLSSKTDTEEKVEEMTTALQSPVVVPRRDMATQMSPEDTNYSSPPLIEPPPCRSEVREVKMDKGAKMIKRPKRRVIMSSSSRIIRREVEDNNNSSTSSWDISEPAMSLSKLQREEAKIAAWENLQKAKAEAAIRKLEVKLEKKKSASMDKILNKLQTAKIKAQEMRKSTESNEHEQQQEMKITHLVRRHTFLTPFLTCFAPRI